MTPPLLLSRCDAGTAIDAGAPAYGTLLFELPYLQVQAVEPDAPEWIKVAPTGTTRTRDGRTFSFDAAALIAAFAADGVDLPVDIGHATERNDGYAAPAVAWINRLEQRAEGLFGRVEWLEAGLWALRSRAYRYVSPSFFHTADGAAIRIKSVGLVTTPALGMPAVASCQSSGATPMKALLAALGLPETATEQEALTKLSTLTQPRADMVPASQLAAINTQVTSLQAEIARRDEEALTARCQALVDKAVTEGKVAPAAKDHYLALARASFEACEAALAAMPAVLAAGAAAQTQTDPSAAPAALTEQQRAIAAACGLTAEQFLAAA